MFGHTDDKKYQDQPINDLLTGPALDGVLSDGHQNDSFNPALPPHDDQPQPATDVDSSTPVDPSFAHTSLDDDSDITSDTSDSAPAEEVASPARSSEAPVISNGIGASDDLLKIKQQALEQLIPMVDHLDQNPEEKFRTTMMMIQANDNQDLVKVAYEAAQAITDEKVRAKALLDIVNEINYFTTQHPNA